MAFLVVMAVMGWLSADASNNFPEALAYAAGPRPAGAQGYVSVTAAALNAEQPGLGAMGLRVRYVDADQRSSGPFVVSVHPIDPSTWAAVALGPNGRCYATLITSSDPPYGATYYATFPVGSRCVGSAATSATVTESDTPQ